MNDNENIGIAYFDRDNRLLHFANGWEGSLEAAEEDAQDKLNRGIYHRAVQATVYRGRTPEIGEVLRTVRQSRR